MTPLEKCARAFWIKRDAIFPSFTRQTWEQGSLQAQQATIAQVRAVLESLVSDKELVMHAWIDCDLGENVHPATVFTAMIDHILSQ